MNPKLPPPKPQLMIGWNSDALSTQGYFESALERFADLLLHGAIEIRTIRPLEDLTPSGAIPDRAEYVRLVFESGVTQPRVDVGGQSYRFPYVPERWLTELEQVLYFFPPLGVHFSWSLRNKLADQPIHQLRLFGHDPVRCVGDTHEVEVRHEVRESFDVAGS